LFVGFAVSPGTVARVLGGGGFVWALSMATVLWRRFNQQYRLTVAESSDGLHLRGGLVALTAEIIRPGRVQAVRVVEPVLWRPLGWCRLEVDVAGRQRGKGEGEAQRGQLRALLPVGRRAVALELVDRLVPDRPRELSRPPRRVLWKSPFRYRALSWGRSETCVATTSGRLRRVACWVPLEKVQSLRHVQGPIQRRLRLASVHVDTAGKTVHATLRDRDLAEAAVALEELTDLARAARRRVALA
jgi:putative membrane protein